MYIMTNRQEKILRYLLSKDKIISGQELAKQFDVTTRTIRNDITVIESILENKSGLKINRFKGKGYKIEILQNDQLFAFLESLNSIDEKIPVEPEERINYLLNRLLLSSQYLKLDDLADELFISRSTIQNDFINIKVIVEKLGLSIISKSNYGVKLVGDETKRRFAISEQLISEISSWNYSILNNLIISNDEILILKSSVLNQLKLAKLNLSDMSLNNLIIHIAIACKRVRDGSYIKGPSIKNSQEKEFLVAKEIINEVSNKLDIKFPDVELSYIAMHLMGTKLFFNKEEKIKWSNLEHKISEVAMEMINVVEKKLKISFKDDPELLAALSLHLKPVLHRYENNMSIRNTMLEAIKVNYPIAFEAGVSASRVVENRFEILVDESEIGFIALHFGAAMERLKVDKSVKRCLIVCTTGLGSSRLLYYKLQSKFGDKISIIGTTELHNIDVYDEKSIDLIISTVPLPNEIEIPFIVVDALLGKESVEQIEKRINTNHGSVSHLYLNKESIYLNKKLNSPEEVINYICNDLVEKKIVSGDILESVISRENAAPTSFGNLVAMPHPLEAFTTETFWSLLTLEKQIDWYNKPVQLVCFLHVAISNVDELEPLYKELLSLLDDKSKVQELLDSTDESEILKILENLNTI
ncbi:BglG family transcription antiterminator [Enterococcus entomosocium]|uniref:BglG family transcription antiterminator n=1 Tax=Enterococcus entomosocium TaxID=3034352 RepID=UPI003D6AD013